MNTIERCKPLLGTYTELTVRAALPKAELLEISQLAFQEIHRIQCCMSFHDPLSELTHLNNNAATSFQEVSAEMMEVLRAADKLNRLSNGLFDPCVGATLVRRNQLPIHVNKSLIEYQGQWSDIEIQDQSVKFHKPLMLDLGGIAKGYAVDRAVSTVPLGVRAVVNAGGDIRMTDWQNTSILIRHKTGGVLSTINQPMLNSSIASSGSYYNEGETVMINPTNNQPYGSERTYSVFADNCIHADALTKIAWLALDHDPDLLDKVLDAYQATAIVN